MIFSFGSKRIMFFEFIIEVIRFFEMSKRIATLSEVEANRGSNSQNVTPVYSSISSIAPAPVHTKTVQLATCASEALLLSVENGFPANVQLAVQQCRF